MNVPLLLIDKTTALLIVGDSVMSRIPNLHEAILGYIAVFYLMDFDYPVVFELGLTMLQFLFFMDKNIPGDLLASFNMCRKDYDAYKEE